MVSIPELVDRPTAAELLGGVSIKTVDRLRKRGEIGSCSIGERSIRISRESIRAYLERQLPPAQAPEVERACGPLFPIPALEEARRHKAARRAEAGVGEGAG